MTSRRKRLATSFLVATACLLLTTASAFAANPDRSRATDKGKAVAPAAVTLEYNPWGCSTSTDNPHLSGHYPGTSAALASHTCSGYYGPNRLIRTWPDRTILEGWLYYESCFLIFCSWNQVDHRVAGWDYVSRNLYLTLAANCNNGNNTKWRLVATGGSYGYNGSGYQTYYSTSQSISTFACGR
jgi:hypothetical protein